MVSWKFIFVIHQVCQELVWLEMRLNNVVDFAVLLARLQHNDLVGKTQAKKNPLVILNPREPECKEPCVILEGKGDNASGYTRRALIWGNWNCACAGFYNPDCTSFDAISLLKRSVQSQAHIISFLHPLPVSHFSTCVNLTKVTELEVGTTWQFKTNGFS